MRTSLRIFGLFVLLFVVIVAAGELAGWPGLAPRLATRIAPALGLSVDADSRMHLIGTPRLLAPSVSVSRDGETLAQARDLELHWAWIDLWQWHRHNGPLRLRQVHAEQLDIAWDRDAEGRSNWQAKNQPKAVGEPMPLPVIDSLLIRHGNAHIADAPLQLQADAKFNTAEDGSWKASVDGSLRGQKLALQAQAKETMALLSAANTQPSPTQVQATLTQQGSRIHFEGAAASLLDARSLDGHVEVSGPSLAAVGKPFGVTLPATRPFELKGRLQHVAGLWTLSGTQASVGRSRLGGDFRYDTRRDNGHGRPLLSGDLRGGPLLLADLGPAVGTDARPSRPGRVLPDRALDIPSLARMDADMTIHLSSLDLGSSALAALSPVNAKLTLQDGELALRDVHAGIAGGQLSGDTTLNSRVDPPAWQAHLMVQGMALERWLQKTDTIAGKLQVKADVRGHGRSTAQLLGSMDGTVSMVLQDGRMSHLVTEMMGLDIGSTSDHRIRIDPAPSIEAASRSSCGIESKNRFSRKMLKALATEGSQIAQGVSSRLTCSTGRSMTVRYCGTISTIAGIISVASIAPRTTLPSTGRSLEKA